MDLDLFIKNIGVPIAVVNLDKKIIYPDHRSLFF